MVLVVNTVVTSGEKGRVLEEGAQGRLPGDDSILS